MRKTQIIYVRIDTDTKSRLKNFAQEMNMTMSGIINSQIKQLLRDGKLFYSAEKRTAVYDFRHPIRKWNK